MDSTITEEAMLAMADRLEWRQSPFDFKVAANMLRTLAAERNTQSCTCHPDDNPPRPCPRQYALSECRKVASERAQQTGVVTDESAKSALQAYINVSGIVDTPGGDYLPIDEDAMRAAIEAIAPMLRGVPDVNYTHIGFIHPAYLPPTNFLAMEVSSMRLSKQQVMVYVRDASPSPKKDNG